jgi:hypothetical protein
MVSFESQFIAKCLIILGVVACSAANLAQLGKLMEFYTPYFIGDLIHHGNWCGFGGNRSKDGLTIDECDSCCKSHDACYSALLYSTREELSIFNSRSGTIWGGRLLPNPSRRCIPYVDIYLLSQNQKNCLNTGGLCAERTCQCDLDFVKCLQHTNCEVRSSRLQNK